MNVKIKDSSGRVWVEDFNCDTAEEAKDIVKRFNETIIVGSHQLQRKFVCIMKYAVTINENVPMLDLKEALRAWHADKYIIVYRTVHTNDTNVVDVITETLK